jgi:protease YdgD
MRLQPVFAIVTLVVALAGCVQTNAPAPQRHTASVVRKSPGAFLAAGATPSAATRDACPFANDHECDEPDIGTGACPMRTDYSDCRFLREGEADACQWARDGECDEPRFGTGACVMGSDRTDCGNVAYLRFRDDSCEFSFNDVCDEPGRGTGLCPRRTDRADCVGRRRPRTISDHFFGRDDRMRVDTTEYPWSIIGRLQMRSGVSCTAALIGKDALLTAAHCIASMGGIDARGEFITASGTPGGPRRARVIAFFVDPAFDYRRLISTTEIHNLDWALLRITPGLGETLGHAGVRDLVAAPVDGGAANAALYQAGYSWDTGDRLAGSLRCNIVRYFEDGTFAHNCDTTHGDSGSPLMMRDGDRYYVAGVASNFRSNPKGAILYVAVGAAAFERYVPDFLARRIGRGVSSSK